MCLYTKVGELVGATPLPSAEIPVTIRTRNREHKQKMSFGTIASSCDDGGVSVEIVDENGVSIDGVASWHSGIKITVCLDELSLSIH